MVYFYYIFNNLNNIKKINSSNNNSNNNNSNNNLQGLICNNYLTYLNVYCKKDKEENKNINCKAIYEKYKRICLDK